MRMTTLLSATLLALLATGFALTACSKSDESTAAEATAEMAEGAFVEAHDGGSITWRVAPNGEVKALVKSLDGKPLAKDVSGELVWKGPAGETKVPLTLDKTGVLGGTGPKLEADLTEVKYTLTVAGKLWIGALHLPVGGTPELVVSAKTAAQKVLVKGKVGPNGGVVQVVGDDLVEIVADKGTGQVRVYVLDVNYKPIAIGERTIKLGVVVNNPEIIVLTADPGGLYFVGKLSAKVDPVKLTIAVTLNNSTNVALVNYAPGAIVVVGALAPAIKILVVDARWGAVVNVKTPGVFVIHDDDDDDDDHRHRGHGHGHGRRH